jgi:hypothetical protein
LPHVGSLDRFSAVAGGLAVGATPSAVQSRAGCGIHLGCMAQILDDLETLWFRTADRPVDRVCLSCGRQAHRRAGRGGGVAGRPDSTGSSGAGWYSPGAGPPRVALPGRRRVNQSSRPAGPDDGTSGHATAPSAPIPPGGASRSDERLAKEYFALLDIVKDFDKNLLTVKGWGATVSLAALGLGFKEGHYGIFLVAALSGLSFWVIDAAMKLHQIRHYVRMREIEVLSAESGQGAATPQIDWSWTIAPGYFLGRLSGPPPRPDRYRRGDFHIYVFWLYPHVALPYAIAVAVGAVLFVLGYLHALAIPI